MSMQKPVSAKLASTKHVEQTRRLESLGQLAAGIAHEINTPTQFVSDNVRFLQAEFSNMLRLIEKYEQVLGEQGLTLRSHSLQALKNEIDFDFLRNEVPQALTQSLEGLERVTTIVRAMKEFSHPGSAEKEQADVCRLIVSTLEVCRNRWKYVAELRTQFEANLPTVPLLVSEFNQVILNLVVNAADAIGEKFGIGESRQGVITIGVRSTSKAIEISVADNGTGISPAARQHMFEPFFTTKGVGKGTGQGLAICSDVIVNKHGGSIDFDTREGEGTTFVLRLPLLAAFEPYEAIDIPESP